MVEQKLNITDLTKITLEPNDILVIEVDEPNTSDAELEHIMEYINQLYDNSGRLAIVKTPAIDISTIPEEDMNRFGWYKLGPKKDDTTKE